MLYEDVVESLRLEGSPRMLVEALKLYGVEEIVGDKHNPVILGWADEVGVRYDSDEVPWCGLFMAVVAKRAGKVVVDNPLWARNWCSFGEACEPELGCVLVFRRGNGGHVGLYVGEDDRKYYVLGGNQDNAVCIVGIVKNRLLAARDSYRNKPANVRGLRGEYDFRTSTDEA